MQGGEDLRKLPPHLRKTSLARLLARQPEGISVNPFERGERSGCRLCSQQRTFCDALYHVPGKESEMGADVPEAAYVGLPLLREFERRRDMADDYAGCH